MKFYLIIFASLIFKINFCWSFESLECNRQNLSFVYQVDEDSGDVSEISKIDKSFNSILPLIKYFSLPEKTKIIIDKSSERRNASPETNSLYIGLEKYNLKYEVNPVLAHECGHLVFNNSKNIEKLFPKEKIKDIKTKINFAPYDEFFADLIAVLTTRDGQSIYFSMYDHSKERDFSKNSEASSIKVDEEKLIFKDDHHYFINTRKLIWEYFEKSGKSQESASKLLQMTYQMIGKNIVDRYNSGESYTGEANQAEIDKIESSFFNDIKSELRP